MHRVHVAGEDGFKGVQGLAEVGWGLQGVPVPRKGCPVVPSFREMGVMGWGDPG